MAALCQKTYCRPGAVDDPCITLGAISLVRWVWQCACNKSICCYQSTTTSQASKQHKPYRKFSSLVLIGTSQPMSGYVLTPSTTWTRSFHASQKLTSALCPGHPAPFPLHRYGDRRHSGPVWSTVVQKHTDDPSKINKQTRSTPTPPPPNAKPKHFNTI